ncbi:hypothetical protein [Burkholderia sp. WAC0059]|nr:hypothetical protein [Burkholderia sp. WAC0059]
MKRFFALAAAVLLCAACAQGGAPSSSSGASGITMYGTLDQGVVVSR